VVVPFQRPIIKFIDWVWASCRLYGLWFIVTVRKILMSNFILCMGFSLKVLVVHKISFIDDFYDCLSWTAQQSRRGFHCLSPH